MGFANDMMEEFYEAQRIAKQAIEQRDELAEALRASVELIKAWHNIGMPKAAADQTLAKLTWGIYYAASPEMKSIRETLAKLK